MTAGLAARIAAGCVAFTAWAGLAVQFVVSYRMANSALVTVWTVFAYFTIWTNLLVAVVFSAVAANRTSLRSSWIVAGAMLSILLVGGVYALLLHGSSELSGGSAVANVVLHMVTPVLALIFWMFYAQKGELTLHDPLKWAIYPLLYLLYALVRGAMTGQYAYPFLDALLVGWRQVAINATAIAVAFLVTGLVVVWIDSLLGRRLEALAG